MDAADSNFGVLNDGFGSITIELAVTLNSLLALQDKSNKTKILINGEILAITQIKFNCIRCRININSQIYSIYSFFKIFPPF